MTRPDRSTSRTVVLGLVVVTVLMALFPLAVRTPVTAALAVLCIGAVSAAIVPALQARCWTWVAWSSPPGLAVPGPAWSAGCWPRWDW
ncbi:hypothetical protein [Nakamurella leprariae]|uniref:Uncharacterized protein n=1 Tax=Nakamurella leprariae TaxID=2803911 RepID=A0A938Y5I0_9ACTN|nr:hypothetical protein [Nakamurella leprariae]MBM9466155.1 hypothetical protein [Nakamurella leprariae]